MPDESRNLRIVHNGLSSQELSRILNLRGWNERKLAEVSGIVPSVVSTHLSGKRVIRSQHLAAYLKVLDRQERVMFLGAWLRDNLDHVLVADLLDGTKTDSMPTLEENQRRMLDWWATAIARDSKLAKIFSHLTTKAGFKFPSLLLLPVSIATDQFQGWLLEKTSNVWYLVRSLCFRIEHAAIALVTLIFGLCQQGRVTQQTAELAEQVGDLTGKAVATSLVATSFVAPALADTTHFDSNLADALPTVQPSVLSCQPDIRKGKVASRPIAKKGARRAQARYQVNPGLRIERTIDHQWRRLVAARKSVHSAFARLISDAHPHQSKQKHRKQR
jgi:hypothetical protein